MATYSSHHQSRVRQTHPLARCVGTVRHFWPPAELYVCGVAVVVLLAAGVVGAAGAVGAAEPVKPAKTPEPSPAYRSPAWLPGREFRVVVRVPPRELPAGRSSDQQPAEVQLGTDLLRQVTGGEVGPNSRIDLASLRIQAFSPQDGAVLPANSYRYVHAPEDLGFRWYDAAIPYDFPEFGDAVSRTGGELRYRPKVRGGAYFNTIGEWRRGKLVWMHTQRAAEPAYYAISFNLMADDGEPRGIPPRAWIGDGTPRCDGQGLTTTGQDHTRIDLADWNGDGLVDLLVGDHTGHVSWWPNLGTSRQPEYRYGKFVEADGKPLDAGLGAAPRAVDFDGDGILDLLVGTHWNRLLYFQGHTVDGSAVPGLTYRGPVMLDGAPLELPITPLARGSEQVFRRDYYPVPEAVDWDGDGDRDLLLGGYITGRIYLYENTRQSGGVPELKFRGPLEADGKPINVGHWCAAPCAADLDGDGDLDLLSGNMPMYLTPAERKQPRNPLKYYENIASPGEQPRYRAAALPRERGIARIRLATPRVWDWDGDGDLDLAVSADREIYLFPNLGSPRAPRFRLEGPAIQVPGGLAHLTVDRFLDYNQDGKVDLVRGYTLAVNTESRNPFAWERIVPLLPPGVTIAHPSGIGDDWFFPHLVDFNRDGHLDVLFGDWSGHIWWHENRLVDGKRGFDLQGRRLQTRDGAPIKVGPQGGDPDRNFDVLQGARTVLAAADFDGDQRLDLVVGDTFGKIRLYRNLGPGEAPDNAPRERAPRGAAPAPVFAAGVLLGDLGIRGLVDVADWDQDGWNDVVASAANGNVRVFLNRGPAQPGQFAEGFDPQLPPIRQPRILMVDLNGDGDEDLFSPSLEGSCFIERSFLQHGYARSERLVVERVPNGTR